MSTPWNPDEFIRAQRFAAEAHRGQTVPGTDLPYLLHVASVAMEIAAALRAEPGHDEDLAIQCALLHDVLEDTHTEYATVKAEFGPAVANGVMALSKNQTLASDRRMADSLRRIRENVPEVWMVKMADRITNLQPPPPHWTPEKIAAYREEARAIHGALRDASPFLAARLSAKIDAYGRFYSAE